MSDIEPTATSLGPPTDEALLVGQDPPPESRTRPADLSNASRDSSGLRVIIVGGGIGGLSAAIALRRRGHDPVVLERATKLQESGAGITLFANAMNALDCLGVADGIRASGSAARHSAILTSEGAELTTLRSDLLQGAVAIHRAGLQEALAAAVGDLRLGVEVTSVHQAAEEVFARTADGSEERGDLLVGADGLWSRVRGSIADATPRYAGYTAWRGISPVAVDPGRLSESWGAGERFGLIDIGSRTYWFATAKVPERETEDPSQHKAELIERFSGWHSPIGAVLAATPQEAILRNDIYSLDPLPQWSNDGMVLLGDAAHATTPGIGQGAAMAIEDALVLADQLGTSGDLAAALARYEAIRRPRTQLVLKLSRRADSAAQITGTFGTRLRNFVVRRTPPSLQARQLAAIVHHQNDPLSPTNERQPAQP